MAGIDLPKMTTIYKAGQPMTALHLITNGRVRVQYPGGEYQLGKGDVIGLGEITSEVHFLNYTAIEDINILTYSYSSMDTLMDLLQKHPDVARIFLLSAFRQMNLLQSKYDASTIEASNLFSSLLQHYQTYREICGHYRLTAQVLPAFDILDTSFLEDDPDIWLSNYYRSLLRTFSTTDASRMLLDPAIIYGFLRKASQDFLKTYSSIEERHLHKKQLLHFYMNENSQDLFAYFTTLYHALPPACMESETVSKILEYIIELFRNDTSPAAGLFAKRIINFNGSLRNRAAYNASQTEQSYTVTYSKLANSLATILEYAGADSETQTACHKAITAYKALPDRNSNSDAAESLRKELSTYFYSLYSLVVVKSLKENNAPLPVQLFLYYGYMDEELAGAENCHALTQLLQQKANCEQTGVYTFFDWLKAIYEDKKEPSRNEYDEDYTDYVHKQKLSGNISEAQAKALEKDTLNKVTFELRNMFPLANKMTYGRLTTFCPIFTAENVLKPLNTSYVNASSFGQVLTRLRTIDFSLFFRETTNPDTLSPFKELIHIECLPDFILMPNVGIRGVMWQEIEGKRRTTPSRMIFSIFHMEELFTSIVRVAGEYRWEICKRLQGFRWNDISTRSLTSEYFDYIQFYRKNRNLSTEAKERIKNNLQRARNSYKEMFVRDYILWILFESSGSPRLNKISREIFFNYCPFTVSIRDTLKQNPQYSESMQKYDLKCQQKLHHLNQFRKKLLLSGAPIPKELDDEIDFFNG